MVEIGMNQPVVLSAEDLRRVHVFSVLIPVPPPTTVDLVTEEESRFSDPQIQTL